MRDDDALTQHRGFPDGALAALPGRRRIQEMIMHRTLSRQQLYEMVWDRALSRIAPELGISDVALRKQCIKHGIPLPDARYRGLISAGRPAPRRPLPPLPANAPDDRVVIHTVERQTMHPDVAAAISEHSKAGAITVPDTLHSLVKRSLAAAREATPDLNGAIKCIDPELFRIRAHADTLERVGTFLNHLVRNALHRGWSAGRGREGLGLSVDGETMSFTVNQTIRRLVHIATAEERQRQERWDARHRGDSRDRASRPQIPSHDFAPTGEMSLEIDQWGAYGVARHRFADRGQTRIEDRIDDILTSFVAVAAGRVVARAEAAERARVEELAGLERARLKRLAEFEGARTAWLAERVALHAERDRLASFLAALEQPVQQDQGHYSVFLEWAQRKLDELDRQLTPAALADAVGTMAAFAPDAFCTPGSVRTTEN